VKKGPSGRGAAGGDVLDWLYRHGRRRDEEVPEFDVEKTLRLVRAVREVGAREPDPGCFWSLLNQAERGDLVSAADKQAFPDGSVLMREGEQAGNVMIILDGWTTVSVGAGGRERVIARRGPGDLIGEQGAARDGLRSATVVVVEEVLALVISTEDFAAIISEHPGMNDIVKQQKYDRGQADPGRPKRRLRRRGKHTVQGGDAPGGRTDVQDDRPGGPLHRPGGPRAALGLDGDQGAELVLRPGLGAETEAQAVRGLGAFGQRPGHQLIPARDLGREVG
jgi:CRP-like cAMP-binding protein